MMNVLQQSKFRRNNVVMSDWVSVYVFYNIPCTYIASILLMHWYKLALYSLLIVNISMNNCNILFIMLWKNSQIGKGISLK